MQKSHKSHSEYLEQFKVPETFKGTAKVFLTRRLTSPSCHRLQTSGPMGPTPEAEPQRGLEAPLAARSLPGTAWLTQGPLGPSAAWGSGGLTAGGEHAESMLVQVVPDHCGRCCSLRPKDGKQTAAENEDVWFGRRKFRQMLRNQPPSLAHSSPSANMQGGVRLTEGKSTC